MIIVPDEACKNNRSNFCEAAAQPKPDTFADQLRSITRHKLEFDADDWSTKGA